MAKDTLRLAKSDILNLFARFDAARQLKINSEIKEIKKWQVTYIAPLNHLSLLHSCPGEVQQELVV